MVKIESGNLEKYKPNKKGLEISKDILILWHGKVLGKYLYGILNSNLTYNTLDLTIVDYIHNNGYCLMKYDFEYKKVIYLGPYDYLTFKKIIKPFFDFEII